MFKNTFPKGEIIIYKTPRGPSLEVKLKEETVWLTQTQISQLFATQRPAITKHLNNIFKSSELNKKSVCSILEHTAVDGKIYKTQFYNLDAIISVGYRVNSKRATQFRIWATETLKNHLVKGYTINEKMLQRRAEQLKELQSVISFLKEKSKHDFLKDKGQEILNLLSSYSESLSILEQYDKNKLTIPKGKKAKFVLTYEESQEVISKMKTRLNAGNLFGQKVASKLESVIKNLYQTFDGKELYFSLEEKAAHLLYLTIKDHPFVDGNKRIASFLFVYFLDKNNHLYKENGERKINDSALVSLVLLVATSQPREKEVMIKIIANLLK